LEPEPPYWRLLSVLVTSVPLTPKLAMRLHRSAYELHRSDGGVASIAADGDLVLSGEVRNLRRDAVLGTIAGPLFEAHLETERGKGFVRFLLTQEGLEAFADRDPRPLN
jgi:hypothetical protein